MNKGVDKSVALSVYYGVPKFNTPFVMTILTLRLATVSAQRVLIIFVKDSIDACIYMDFQQ